MEQATKLHPQPGTTPMNLTCAPMTGATTSGTQVYAIVFNSTGAPQPPDSTWSPLDGFTPGTGGYVLQGTDFHGNSGHCDMKGTNIAVFTKTI